VGSWAAALPSLRRLKVDTGWACQLHLTASLTSLSRLQSLQLSAPRLHIGPAVALPPLLTRLTLSPWEDPPLPALNLQVRASLKLFEGQDSGTRPNTNPHARTRVQAHPTQPERVKGSYLPFLSRLPLAPEPTCAGCRPGRAAKPEAV